jgi:signal transduction histidine kinase
MPERIRFRYRLIGAETDWTDAGDRRQAFFTNLAPGDYRFQVIAANNDGVWNTAGATMSFSIAPTFLQSLWFKVLVVLVLVGLAWLAYSLRIQQEAARLQSRFDVRIAERERIARELHDTLLQGFQGLLLRFQSITNRVPAGGELRKSLEDALDRADAVLVEGRARVRELRAEAPGDDLAKAIVDNAHKAMVEDTPRFDLTIEGSPRPLHTLVADEVTRVAEEAIRNALEHAKAHAIEVILSYGRSELRLSVRDDGVGMSQDVLAAGRREGHYGLVGMQERAARIGARLDVSSGKDAGTEVTLSIPARAAYKDQRLLFEWLTRPWARRFG